MRVYGCYGMSWNNMIAPNFKDNDTFYVIYAGEITAVKIKHSYFSLRDGSTADLMATFETPTRKTDLDAFGCLSLDTVKKFIYLSTKSLSSVLPVYESVEDAMNDVKCYRYVGTTRLEVKNTGYEYAKIENCGWMYDIDAFYWTYDKSNYQPIRCSNKAHNLVWDKNGECLLLSNKETPIPNGGWCSESEVVDYLSKIKKTMNVISFPEEEKPEEVSGKKVTLTIAVTADMSLNDIAMLIAKQMDGKEE